MADVVPETPSPSNRPTPSRDYAVFWLDLHARVTRWSAEAHEILGHSDAEASGLVLHDLFTESDRSAGVPDRAIEAARDRGAWDGIGWRVARDGTRFWATTSLTMVYTPNGLGIGVMAVVRRLDATPVSEAITPATKRLASLGRVTCEVSHDVRNILTAIRGFAAVLERRLPEGDAAHQVWHELVKACDRGAELTERVLGVVRSEPDVVAAVSIADVLTSLEPMLRQIVPSRIRVEIRAADEVAPVLARQHDVELALLNVVVNARDAIRGPGLITVELTEDVGGAGAERRVVLAVRDSGKGMSPDIQDRIFERFFTTKVEGRGTGLGMAMVRDSVRTAGGSIEIESEQGSGTVVRMLFAPHQGVQHDGVASETLGPAGADASRRERRRVLVWCQSPVLRAATAELLGRMGFGVSIASTEALARKLMEDHSALFDCLIVDGTAEIQAVVVSRQGGDEIPVIALMEAGQSGAQASQATAESGADRVFVMPLDPHDLCEAVSQLASDKDQGRASVH